MGRVIQGSGYKGIFSHSLLTDVLVKPFNGSVASESNASYSTTGNAALDQMKKEVEASKPGQKIDTALLSGYASTDMFIQALKTAAKKGNSAITPENIQKISATQTWEMKDFTGPVKYPVASNRSIPYCTSLAKSDGTQWVDVESYSCSSKTFPFKP